MARSTHYAPQFVNLFQYIGLAAEYDQDLAAGHRLALHLHLDCNADCSLREHVVQYYSGLGSAEIHLIDVIRCLRLTAHMQNSVMQV